jgi:hypothetical protein
MVAGKRVSDMTDSEFLSRKEVPVVDLFVFPRGRKRATNM